MGGPKAESANHWEAVIANSHKHPSGTPHRQPHLALYWKPNLTCFKYTIRRTLQLHFLVTLGPLLHRRGALQIGLISEWLQPLLSLLTLPTVLSFTLKFQLRWGPAWLSCSHLPGPMHCQLGSCQPGHLGDCGHSHCSLVNLFRLARSSSLRLR